MTDSAIAFAHRVPRSPTLTSIKEWPPTCSVEQAALALGISRSAAYEAVRLGQFPARVIKVRRRVVIVTDDLIRILSA